MFRAKWIGPHNYDVLCFFYGILFSNKYAEKHGLSIRISFHHSTTKLDFLYWLKHFLFTRGYCNFQRSKITPQYLKKQKKLYYSAKFHTFTFRYFDPIQEEFYSNGGLKCVPANVADYLTSFALAVWTMMDGSFSGHEVILHCKCFDQENV